MRAGWLGQAAARALEQLVLRLAASAQLGRGLDGLSGLRVLAAVAHAARSVAECAASCGWPARFGAMWRCRSQMFYSASVFNQNLAGWNTASVSGVVRVWTVPPQARGLIT